MSLHDVVTGISKNRTGRLSRNESECRRQVQLNQLKRERGTLPATGLQFAFCQTGIDTLVENVRTEFSIPTQDITELWCRPGALTDEGLIAGGCFWFWRRNRVFVFNLVFILVCTGRRQLNANGGEAHASPPFFNLTDFYNNTLVIIYLHDQATEVPLMFTTLLRCSEI